MAIFLNGSGGTSQIITRYSQEMAFLELRDILKNVG
jgi:hypothetical protein